jgi:hypothetical protein
MVATVMDLAVPMTNALATTELMATQHGPIQIVLEELAPSNFVHLFDCRYIFKSAYNSLFSDMQHGLAMCKIQTMHILW